MFDLKKYYAEERSKLFQYRFFKVKPTHCLLSFIKNKNVKVGK